MDEPFHATTRGTRNGQWAVHLDSHVAKEMKDPKSYPPGIRQKISKALDSLEKDPYGHHGAQLNMDKDIRRMKVGDYRIIYRLDLESKTIFVSNISTREAAYKAH